MEENMKKTNKVLLVLVVLSVLVSGLLSAKDKAITVTTGKKALISDKAKLQGLQVQSGLDNQGDLVFLTSYITNDDSVVGNCVSLNSTDSIYFHTEYVSYSNERVRFHFIWTGPEFYTHSTDWIDVQAYEYNTISVTSGTDWLPGAYKLIVVAEHEYGAGAGIQTVSESRVIFY